MTTERDIEALVADVRLGAGHEDQERAVAAALRRLLVLERTGVVLADEVGFGKTYEALAVLSHLVADAARRRDPFERALVLCKPTLVRKWEEESSTSREGRGFPRYLPKEHPARVLFEPRVHCIDSRAAARNLREEGLRGRLEEGRRQVPPGLYIVNERLLQAEKRRDHPLLKQIWRSHWNVVIVDEAHHYARGNRPQRLFASDGNLRCYEQKDSLWFDKVIALTATPFELSPRELVDLLALVRADERTLGSIEEGLRRFGKALGRFFDLRQRSPNDPLRAQQVALLQHLRDHDALDGRATGHGLQALLRRYLIRNTKRQNERRYFLVERRATGFEPVEFHKLDEDLQTRIQRSPLIPFEGEHTLFYLELRDLIQDVTDRAREEETTRTFIPTDLRQGLSSYPQIESSELLNRPLESARRVRTLVQSLTKHGKLHPKVRALTEVVRDIVAAEIDKVRTKPDAWFSKVLVFNKLIRGTAPQLKKELGELLRDALEQLLGELLAPAGLDREVLARRVRQAVDRQLDAAEQDLRADPVRSAWRKVPEDLDQGVFAAYRGRPLLRVFREPLRRRAVQALAVIDLVRSSAGFEDSEIEAWVEQNVTGRVVSTVRGVIDRCCEDSTLEEPRDSWLTHVDRELTVEWEESKSVELVGRFDGDTVDDREAHRRNFNRRHNPFVLLVGQVGEEGIDLQEQCRYVIHYDLEWNPARMEQREGRVDRLNWGRASEGHIDVRFLLLKRTYEERIFHTVMQRDQWFQILIGSKRRELGVLPEDAEAEVQQDRLADDGSSGALTEAEKAQVILDLRPE